MRLFFALELPNEIKTALEAMQSELRQTRAAVGWTKPENLHLTLRFLGEVETARLPALKQTCAQAAQQTAPLTLTLNGIGFFPSDRKPKVLWAGLADAANALPALHQALETRLTSREFAGEDKPFRAHLTLGRFKAPGNTQTLVQLAQAYQLPALQFTVTELVLMQSQLHPTGSIYTPLTRASFTASLSLPDG